MLKRRNRLPSFRSFAGAYFAKTLLTVNEDKVFGATFNHHPLHENHEKEQSVFYACIRRHFDSIIGLTEFARTRGLHRPKFDRPNGVLSIHLCSGVWLQQCDLR